MTKFSDELVDRITKYFSERDGLSIDKETANEYLNSLADLYEIGIALVKGPTKPDC